jgi:hypothetical protein
MTRHTHCWHMVQVTEEHDEHGEHVTANDPPLRKRLICQYRCCWCGKEKS